MLEKVSLICVHSAQHNTILYIRSNRSISPNAHMIEICINSLVLFTLVWILTL